MGVLGPCLVFAALVDVQGQGKGGAHSEDQFDMFVLLCQRKTKVHALGFQEIVPFIGGGSHR